jgi:hypothetical protein
MRRLAIHLAAVAALVSGCSKHNNAGNPYYFSFQSGNILYSHPVDSSVQNQDSMYPNGRAIRTFSTRTPQQTDSAAAGLRTLVTWSMYLLNRNSSIDTFLGNYTSDTSAANGKMLEPGSVFAFYTGYDPHQGSYYVSPGLSFTVTITQFTSAWFEGTFEGKLLRTFIPANVSDTVTITNGKFRLPLSQ